MVNFTDLKVYKTTNNLGGAITGTQVQVGTENNVFANVPNNERVIGEDYYACIYLKNTNTAEAMAAFKLWLSDKSLPHDTELKWGFDTTAASGGGPGYHHGPSDNFNGTERITVPHTASQDLITFTAACWFRTSHDYVGGEGQMIMKGIGNDDADINGYYINYNLKLNNTPYQNQLECNFLDSSANYHAVFTDSETWNDGNWHWACVTYDKVNERLYCDGVLKMTLATTDNPDNNPTDLTIGAEPAGTSEDHFWFGDLDEVRVWNVGLTPTEVLNYWNTSEVPRTGNLVYENTFGGSGGTTTVVAQTIANKYTSPTGVSWRTVETLSTAPLYGNLGPNQSFPIWLWLHVDANAISRSNDKGIFTTNLNIPQGGGGSGGSGGSGGGTGGNPPPTTFEYRVAISGDWGCEPTTDDIIDLIQTQDYDYVVGVGDNAYEASGCWVTRFTPLKPNFNSGYGNHEYSETGGVSPYKTFFGHSLTYFTFKFQNIQFFVGDTNLDIDPGSAQHTFLTNALVASQSDSTVTWRIGITHHPWFGAGSDHPYDEFNQVEALHTLFQNNHVNIVCCGHNHNNQRTFQVAYNSGSPTSPTIVDSTSPYNRATIGLIHVVTGTGGHDTGSGLYALGSQPGFQAYQNRTYNGVWEINASDNGQTLTCQFREVNGTVHDTFVYA